MSKLPKTIADAARALRARDLSVRELWDGYAEAASEGNADSNAYLELFPGDDAAIANAEQRLEKEGVNAPLLTGIPIAIKDNILIDGKKVSASSRMLENYRATYDATVIEKLREANALFLGRTNMDEFAMGSSTEHSAFGPTKNPLDHSRVPGGSSGGSAAAVAGGLAIASLGSDTGGSIRQPAAHCGLVGLKPTYGAVSRSGLIAMGSSLDQIGPLTHTVADAKVLFEAIRGQDNRDATTFSDGFYAVSDIPKKLRIGIPRHLLEKGVDAEVLNVFEQTISTLKEQGHTIVDVELPMSSYALAAYYVVMPAEVSTNLARLDGMRYGHVAIGDTLLEDYVRSRTEGFGEETRRRILLGTFVLSSGYIDAYYRKADAARDVLRAEYTHAFAGADVIAFPTTPSPAFKFGAKSDPLSMYLEDVFTVTANLTGMPALSVPMGVVPGDTVPLPVGMHFTAPHGREDLLFMAGEEVEKARGTSGA